MEAGRWHRSLSTNPNYSKGDIILNDSRSPGKGIRIHGTELRGKKHLQY